MTNHDQLNKCWCQKPRPHIRVLDAAAAADVVTGEHHYSVSLPGMMMSLWPQHVWLVKSDITFQGRANTHTCTLQQNKALCMSRMGPLTHHALLSCVLSLVCTFAYSNLQTHILYKRTLIPRYKKTALVGVCQEVSCLLTAKERLTWCPATCHLSAE